MRRRRHNARLTINDVISIARSLRAGKSTREIACAFFVTHQTISAIALGRAWAWLTGFNRFSFAAHGKRGAKKKLSHPAHQRENVCGLRGVGLFTSAIDKVSRRMIEDPTFLAAWTAWWKARGEEVICTQPSQ